MTVVDVLCVKRERDGVIFVPAMLDFDDRTSVHKIDVFDAPTRADQRFRVAERACGATDDLQAFASVWLRSRVIAEFRVCPPIASDDWDDYGCGGLLQIPFLAAFREPEGGFAVHPFVCDDVHEGGNPRFEFSRAWTPPGVGAKIAAAFRSLMLSEPLALVSFRQFGVGGDEYEGGYLIEFGIDQDGRAFECGLDEADSEEYFTFPWYEWPIEIPGLEGHECGACGGEGEENFCPIGEPCELCGGTGRVSWRDPWPHSRKRPRRFSCRIFDRRS